MLTAGPLAGGGRLVVGDGDDRGRRPVLGGLSLGGDGGALWDGVRVQGEAAGPADGGGRGGVAGGGGGGAALKEIAAMAAAGVRGRAGAQASLPHENRHRPCAASTVCHHTKEHHRPDTTKTAATYRQGGGEEARAVHGGKNCNMRRQREEERASCGVLFSTAKR